MNPAQTHPKCCTQQQTHSATLWGLKLLTQREWGTHASYRHHVSIIPQPFSKGCLVLEPPSPSQRVAGREGQTSNQDSKARHSQGFAPWPHPNQPGIHSQGFALWPHPNQPGIHSQGFAMRPSLPLRWLAGPLIFVIVLAHVER